MYKNYTKLGFVAAILLTASTAFGATYLSGTVTANGDAYTNTNAYVYISCNNNYNWASDWAYLSSSGTYSFDSSSYYGPCGSYYSNIDFTSCEVYAYPAWSESDLTLAASDHYTISLDCASTLTQDIELNVKDKTIAVSVTAGSNPITEGITVSCSQQQSPWAYSSVTTSTDGVYNVPVMTGTFYCSAWCTNWSSCDYGGYPSTYVTVAESDTAKSASLSFAVKDKTINVAVTAGGDPVTSDITVYCSQQQSPWTYGSSSTSDAEGVYSIDVNAGSYYCYAYCSNWSGCAYSGYPSTNVTVADNDSSVDASLIFTVKDKTLRVTIMAGSSAVTSGMTVYASEQGGGWAYSYIDYATNGKYELAVGTGTYYISAYCSNWSTGCNVAGYPNATVKMEDSDTDSVDVTLTFLADDSTLSGAVTDGTNGVANASVSVYSYTVSNGTGTATAWSIAKNIGKATITGGTAETTSVYKYASTDANGAFQMTLPAGTYTVSVYPPWTQTNLGSTSLEVTVDAAATKVVSIILPSKTSVISGSATDATGAGLSNVYISGWSYSGQGGSSDWFWTQSDANGAFSVYAIEGLKYNVSAWYWSSDQNNTVCNYNNEGMQTVVAASTPQTINFTYPICDCTVTMNAIDSNGSVLSSIYGGVNASPTTLASGEYWYGLWGNLSGGTGTIKVQSDVEYTFSPYIWDSSYVQDDDVSGTCTDSAVTVNFPMLPLDATISGSYVDGNGYAIALDTYSYMYVYATKGKAYRSCTASSSGYSCNVSAGTWCLGFWIDQNSGYASSSAAASSTCSELTSGGSLTQNITLLQTGTINVTVLDVDGSGKANTWTEATVFSNNDKGGLDNQWMYMSNGCMTTSDGTCSINVGAAEGDGTVYYINVYVPYYMKTSENIMNPQEVSVTVVAGETVDADPLTFLQPDGTSIITVTEGSATASISLGKSIAKEATNSDEASASPTANATVDCFSTSGGSFEVETDENGVATCPCSTTDTWKTVAHNMVANNLWMSEATDVTCTAEGGVGTATMSNVATVPEGKSMTITDAATQAMTIELSDGFSVFFPAGSTGESGDTTTCNVDVTVTPFTSNKRPASFYGYTVSCQDGDGASVIQLNSNATFNVPCSQTQIENLGLTTDDVSMCYFDSSTGAYKDVDNGYTMDGTNCVVTYQQNHLTDFVVVGNGNLAGVAGTEAGEEANEHGEEGGTGSGADAAAASSGCGCNVGGEATLAEKMLAPVMFIGLFIALHAARICMKKAKK